MNDRIHFFQCVERNVAENTVAIAYIAPRRRVGFAYFAAVWEQLTAWAARVEAAATGRVECAGHIAFESDTFLFRGRVRNGDG